MVKNLQKYLRIPATGFDPRASGTQQIDSLLVAQASELNQFAESFAASASFESVWAAIPWSVHSDFKRAAAWCSDRSTADRCCRPDSLRGTTSANIGRSGIPRASGVGLVALRYWPGVWSAAWAAASMGKSVVGSLAAQKSSGCQTTHSAAAAPRWWSFGGTAQVAAVSLVKVARLAGSFDHVDGMLDWRGYLNSFKG